MKEAMTAAVDLANPGRSGHGPAVQASRLLYECREVISSLFDFPAERLAFCSGATAGLNTAICGLLKGKSSRVCTTDLEHNAVARLLRELESRRIIEWICLPGLRGEFAESLKTEIRKNKIDLVVLVHASNVTGVMQDTKEVTRLCRENSIPVVLDAAQTAGMLPVDSSDADVIVFSGHKALAGPAGIGAIMSNITIQPAVFGGTGSNSESLLMPESMPDAMEAGTQNLPGIAGLARACEVAGEESLERRFQVSSARRRELCEGLESLAPRVRLHSPREGASAVAFSVPELDEGELTHRLWKRYSVCLRSGLHCAPLAHQTLGTFPNGCMRASVSHKTTSGQIGYFVKALEECLKSSD